MINVFKKSYYFHFHIYLPQLRSQLLKGRNNVFFILCPSIFTVSGLEQTNYLVNEWDYMKFVY